MHQHQLAGLQAPGGEQLRIAQGLQVAHLGRQVAVGGGRQAQVLRPQARREALAAAARQLLYLAIGRGLGEPNTTYGELYDVTDRGARQPRCTPTVRSAAAIPAG